MGAAENPPQQASFTSSRSFVNSSSIFHLTNKTPPNPPAAAAGSGFEEAGTPPALFSGNGSAAQQTAQLCQACRTNWDQQRRHQSSRFSARAPHRGPGPDPRGQALTNPHGAHTEGTATASGLGIRIHTSFQNLISNRNPSPVPSVQQGVPLPYFFTPTDAGNIYWIALSQNRCTVSLWGFQTISNVCSNNIYPAL